MTRGNGKVVQKGLITTEKALKLLLRDGTKGHGKSEKLFRRHFKKQEIQVADSRPVIELKVCKHWRAQGKMN